MSLAACAAAALMALQPGATLESSLTREEARTLPVETLARRLLGAAGELVREVMRPPPQPFPGETELRQLVFASAPRWARIAGLCEADIFSLRFEPAAETVENAEPPVHVAGLDVTTAFRAIGNVESAGDLWTEGDQREYEPLCTRAGPVLRSDEDDSGAFFGGTSGGHGFRANEAAFAARAFRQAIRSAITGALPRIDCSEDTSRSVPPICTDPRDTLAALSPESADWFEIKPCADATAMLCVVASVPRDVDELRGQRRIAVTIRTDQRLTYPRPARIGIDSVVLQGRTVVF